MVALVSRQDEVHVETVGNLSFSETSAPMQRDNNGKRSGAIGAKQIGCDRGLVFVS